MKGRGGGGAAYSQSGKSVAKGQVEAADKRKGMKWWQEEERGRKGAAASFS